MPKHRKIRYAISRRSRTAFVFLSLLLGAALIWLDHTHTERRRQYRPNAKQQLSVGDFEKYHKKTFTVVNVVDGDTLDIGIHDGNDNHTRIRLWGIDTPETKNPKLGVMYFGPQASEFTRELTLGKSVTVYLDEADTRDKYNRLLAYIQLPDGKYLNELLLTKGFAYADLRFRHSFYHSYQQLEAAARSQKKGLWEKVTRQQLPEWLKKKKPNLLLDK